MFDTLYNILVVGAVKQWENGGRVGIGESTPSLFLTGS